MLGYHHPLAIAKRYGTLDRISGGRLTLGLGVGSLEEEFDLLGAPFAGRGAARTTPSRPSAPPWAAACPSTTARTTTSRAWSWSRTPSKSRSRCGSAAARAALRRALTADGWVPFGLPLKTLAEMLREADVPPAFDVVLAPSRPWTL